MKTRAELKQIAKNRLKENWGWAIGNCVLPSLIIGTVFIALFYLLLLPIALNGDTAEPTGAVAVSMVLMTVLYFLMIFISLLAEVSIVCIFLDFIRGKKEDLSVAFFYPFTKKRFGKFLGTNLLILVYTSLWSFLFIIPGIIKSLSYSQANYVLKDKLDRGQEVSLNTAITESRQLMKGHKWEYFLLQLSFIGWAILSLVTFGLGFFWLQPYIQTTNAAYYEALLEENGLTYPGPDHEEKPSVEAIQEEKEEIVSDLPLMGQPDVQDATMK